MLNHFSLVRYIGIGIGLGANVLVRHALQVGFGQHHSSQTPWEILILQIHCKTNNWGKIYYGARENDNNDNNNDNLV